MPRVRAADGPGRAQLSRAERTPGDALSDDASASASASASEDEVLRLLRSGELRPLGLMPRASNDTLLCELEFEDVRTLAVYKPRDGETPLWDFPPGTLCLREHAAYVASKLCGWDFVPPTVLREGPYGFGAVQLFIDAEPGEHYLTLASRYQDVFMRVAAFDVAINNADRKSGHCLLSRDDARIWVVDHGVTFHEEPKLRTVIWDFAGAPLPAEVTGRLAALRDAPLEHFGASLTPAELDAMRVRIDRFLAFGAFPGPTSRYSYPWPPV
jgi:uncharacterized repeat protein (TIGR03843 family)